MQHSAAGHQPREFGSGVCSHRSLLGFTPVASFVNRRVHNYMALDARIVHTIYAALPYLCTDIDK